MSVLLDENTRLIVQGITGREGTLCEELGYVSGAKAPNFSESGCPG